MRTVGEFTKDSFALAFLQNIPSPHTTSTKLRILLIIMPSTVQVSRITVNDAYKADPTLFDKLREGAKKGGVIHQAYGFEVDNPDLLLWLLRMSLLLPPLEYV